MLEIKKINLSGKDKIAIISPALGLPIAILGSMASNFWVAGSGLIVALIPFLIIERFETKEIRKEINQTQIDIHRRLDHIDAYLKTSPTDKLKVAIFDHLLIYLPMYVANTKGYFKQEDIEVEFVVKLGDELVANAVRSLEAHIGLCDPCMCALEEFSHKGDRLFALAPLVTKSAAKPITKHKLRIDTRLLSGGEDISIATFKSPSTTFVMAVNLKGALEGKLDAKNVKGVKINLVQLEPDAFNEVELPNLLEKYDLVMLWEPLLTTAKSHAETVEFVLDHDVLPNNVMYSALMISERLLEAKPTLGIRLFRAISRASYEIQLAKWDSKLVPGISEAATSEATVSSFDENRLDSMILDMINKELFPLITTPDQLQSPKWHEQLFNAIEYRRQADSNHKDNFNETFRSISTPGDCKRFFCPPEVFKSAKSNIT